MKIKHLIIVSLLLAVMTVGAVSASQDIACNDTLSENAIDDAAISEVADESSDDVLSQEIDEEDDDVLGQSDDDSIIQASAEPEDLLGDYSAGGVKIEIQSFIDITDKYADLAEIYDKGGIKGTITVKLDGTKIFSKKVSTKDTYYYLGTKNLGLDKYGDGYHTVKIIYNNGKDRTDSRKVNFVAIPTVNYPDYMSVGEDNGVSIEGKAGIDGTATLYQRIASGKDAYGDPIYKKGPAIATVKITNGYGWIPLNKLTNGTQSLQLEYKFGTYDDVKTFTIDVRQNSAGFKSSISKTTIDYGKKITVKLTGPKADGDANIYVDNGFYRSVRFNFGVMDEKVTGLSVGKHLITVNYYDYDSDLFYSKTYHVVVNHAINLKLKKATVKKSAKKLDLKATLKIDGKVAKKTKVKFKFNKKTYKAKTNNKGVAKVTIKKKVLKKLKKGKKVTYQVTYGGKTVSKTVKVKK